MICQNLLKSAHKQLNHNTTFIMNKKVYWIQVILTISLLVFQFIDPLMIFGSLRKYSLFLIGLTSLSLSVEKGRIQSPLIILLVLLSITNPSSGFNILKVILTIPVLGLVLGVKKYQIKEKYQFMNDHQKKASKYCGYKSLEIQSVSIAIYYPTNQKSSKKVKWIIGGDKFIKNSISAFQLITHKRIPLPFWFIRFILSYITTYDLAVEADTKIIKKDQHKIVFISHGISNTKHAHSSNAYWWVQRGYIVIAVQHNEEGRIFGPKTKKGDEDSWKNNYQFRNQSVKIRSKQLKTVLESIMNQKTLNGVFGEEINIKSFQLVGHSLGCPTIIQTAYQLQNTQLYSKLTSIITFDPYIYPLSQHCYQNFKRPYLNIKSDKFAVDLGDLQPQLDLIGKNKRIYELNKENIIDLTINGLDHLHQCDLVYIYGTQASVLGMSRGNIQLITQLNTLTIYLFEKGSTQEQILRQTNKFVKLWKSANNISVIPSLHV